SRPRAHSPPAFFFQAADGIRGFHVTGVQTCALPIWLGQEGLALALELNYANTMCYALAMRSLCASMREEYELAREFGEKSAAIQIGRASCRERGSMSWCGGWPTGEAARGALPSDRSV